MLLVVLYIAFVAVVGVISVFTGYVVEQWWGGHVSMIYFLSLNTLSLWLSWVFAVKLTAPKDAPGESHAA
jgi:hypothetical protein